MPQLSLQEMLLQNKAKRESEAANQGSTRVKAESREAKASAVATPVQPSVPAGTPTAKEEVTS
eukprot:2724426-Pyramimonas_sp.AAC.1